MTKQAVLRLWLLILSMGFLQAQALSHIVVGKDRDITTIAKAVETIEPGGTIELTKGVYREHNIQITHAMTIEGHNQAIIDAQKQGHGLIIRADKVVVRNLQVHNSSTSFMDDYSGILVEDAKGVTLENLQMVDNFFGIYLAHSADSTIDNVTLKASGKRETSSGNGIHLWYCKNITIKNNQVYGHRDGIYFEFVENSTITNNWSENNLRYGLHFMFSNNCTYRHNTFQDNGAGVAVMYTNQVIMEHNRFERNWGPAAYGLLLKDIRDSRIAHNLFVQNTIGLYSEASNRLQVQHNDFKQNGWAIKLMANSIDNTFTKNNFIANTFDVATNSKQNYSHFASNYWSQYQGYDLDRNGIGDVPYHPVRLFSIMVEKQPQTLVLHRSLLVDLLEIGERLLPTLTPQTLVDSQPRMKMYDHD